MNKKITSVIMVVAIVITVGAAAITINGYGSVYAESANRGQSYNDGNTHNHCTAIASGGTCTLGRTDSGKHTGLTN
jgi:hypothetical protein